MNRPELRACTCSPGDKKSDKSVWNPLPRCMIIIVLIHCTVIWASRRCTDTWMFGWTSHWGERSSHGFITASVTWPFVHQSDLWSRGSREASHNKHHQPTKTLPELLGTCGEASTWKDTSALFWLCLVFDDYFKMQQFWVSGMMFRHFPPATTGADSSSLIPGAHGVRSAFSRKHTRFLLMFFSEETTASRAGAFCRTMILIIWAPGSVSRCKFSTQKHLCGARSKPNLASRHPRLHHNAASIKCEKSKEETAWRAFRFCALIISICCSAFHISVKTHPVTLLFLCLVTHISIHDSHT